MQYSSSSWSSSSDILLQFHSLMSSLLLVSPWFINDKACQCALTSYLFATVQNVRNNLSDTPTTLVMIDMTFKSMNVLYMMDMRSQVDMLTCSYIYGSYESPLLHTLQCRKHSWFLCHLLSASSGVFLSLLSLYCSLLCVKDVLPYLFNASKGLHHQSFNLHVPRQ